MNGSDAFKRARRQHLDWLLRAPRNTTLAEGKLEACIQSNFLGQLLLALPHEQRELGTPVRVLFDGRRWLLAHDEAACRSATVDELACFLLREAWHLVLEHDARRTQEHDQTAWALATDHAASLGLDGLPNWAMPLTELPAVQQLRDPTAEELHDAILEDPAARSLMLEASNDEDSYPLKPCPTVNWMGRSARDQVVDDTLAEQGALGDVPAIIHQERTFRSQETQATQALLSFVRSKPGRLRRTAWNRTCRRSGMVPGRRRTRTSRIVYVLDTSRSMNAAALEAELAALRGLLRSRPVTGWIIQCDDRVRDVRPMSITAIDELEFVGRGGTDLRPAFEFVRMRLPLVDGIVYGTDGRGLAPTCQERPTLWLVAPGGRQPAPWGTAVFLDANHERTPAQARAPA